MPLKPVYIMSSGRGVELCIGSKKDPEKGTWCANTAGDILSAIAYLESHFSLARDDIRILQGWGEEVAVRMERQASQQSNGPRPPNLRIYENA